MAARIGREEGLVWGGAALAGTREKNLTLNGESINVSDDDSEGWQELLEESGENSVEISISGIDKDDVLMAAWFGTRIAAATWTRDSGAVLTGNFRLASYSVGAPYNGETTFEATLSSTGAIAFTPAS